MSTTLETLKRCSEKFVLITDYKQLVKQFVLATVHLTGSLQVILIRCQSDKHQTKVEETYGVDASQVRTPRIEITTDVSKWLQQEGEILALAEEGSDRFLILLDPNEESFFQCEMRIPLFIQKQLFGVLSLGPKALGMEYSKKDIDLMQILVNIFILAMERLNHPEQFNNNLEVRNNGLLSSQYPVQKSVSQVIIKKSRNADELQGESEVMRQVEEIIERVAGSDVTVLITGESGTGKELVARKIHLRSLRNRFPMVTMNCAALPENLVESELFGHEKGSFTNAFAQKKGRFELADNSTLFLDEIGEMRLETQAKLLRVLQDGTFQRIGGTRTLQSNVRIIAATNKNLDDEIRKCTFRQDLFYRLNVVQIHLPPLRERKDDILFLANYFIDKFTQYYNKKPVSLTTLAVQKLKNYSFPGNIRELQNIVERAVIMEKNEFLTLEFLVGSDPQPVQNICATAGRSSLEELERKHIEDVLTSVSYNKSHAAKILGIARKTLREKIQKYQLKAS